MLEEELALLEENLELAEEQLKKSRVLFTNGLINEQNLLGAQLDVESSKLSYARKQAEYEQERRSFFSTLGIEFDTEVALSGDIDPQIIEADADVLIDRYIGNRLDVRTAALQVSQCETAAHGVAAASRAPSLSLAGRWNGGVEDLWIEASDSLSFGLTVSIPVDPWIPGSSKARAIKEAKANTESAEILLEQTWESAELEIRSLVSSIDQSLQAIEIALLQEAIAEKAYLLAEEGFQSGTVERLELWEIREDLLTARQDVLSERYQYLLYLIQLMDALNIDNLDDLEKLQGE
jgi:outer membrane protein TolC